MKTNRKTTRAVSQPKAGNTKARAVPKPASLQTENLLERVSDGFVAFDADMNYTYVNPKGGELLGRKPKDLVGKNYWVEYPEAKGTPFVNAYVRALEKQETIVLEDYYAPFDRWFENRVYPSKNGLTVFFTEITERKKAEQVIRESEKKYSALFDQAHDAVFILDLEGRHVEANRRAADMLGYTRGELKNLSVSETSGELTESKDVIKRLLNGEHVPHYERIFRKKSGETFPVEINVELVRDAEGNPLHIQSMVRDVTERRRAEEKLKRNEWVLRLFVEHSPAAIAMLDREKKYIVASNRYLSDYDIGEQNVVGRSHYEIFPEIPERWKEIHRRCLAGATERNEEDPFPRASGKMDWIRWEIRPWYESTGEIGGIILFSEVITERKRVETALKDSEQKFSILFEKSAFNAALSKLPDGVLVAVNEAFEKTFGFTRQEAVGKTTQALGINPDAEGRARIVAALKEGGSAHNLEMPLRTRFDEERFFSVNVDLVDIGDQKYILNTTQDITERKRAEDELRLSRERLADLSRRLVEVHETEARAIGRELHDQIGQMLTALKLTLEIAPQLPPESAAQKLAGAQELLDELMNRVSALSLELRPPMLDDLGLVPALLWHVNRFQEQTQIEVDFKHSGAEGRRFGAQVETTAYRVVQESLTNVARHARASRARLEVRVGGEEMEIQIEDDGAGFDPQAAFEKHRGLSAMRERVQLLGGAFQVESQIGKGARKFIRLPLKEGL